jgi:hypothetical protein
MNLRYTTTKDAEESGAFKFKGEKMQDKWLKVKCVCGATFTLNKSGCLCGEVFSPSSNLKADPLACPACDRTLLNSSDAKNLRVFLGAYQQAAMILDAIGGSIREIDPNCDC